MTAKASAKWQAVWHGRVGLKSAMQRAGVHAPPSQFTRRCTVALLFALQARYIKMSNGCSDNAGGDMHQVKLDQVLGLWVILGLSVCLAVAMLACCYFGKHQVHMRKLTQYCLGAQPSSAHSSRQNSMERASRFTKQWSGLQLIFKKKLSFSSQ